MTHGHFNLDGTRRRELDKPCRQCGAMVECDICWEHVSDWSPFGIFPCFACDMPIFSYHPSGAGCEDNLVCTFCGQQQHKDK
jgi:hypothetical protein